MSSRRSLGASIVALLTFPPSTGLMGVAQFGLAAFLSIGLSTSGFGPLYRRAEHFLARRAEPERAGHAGSERGRASGRRRPVGVELAVAAASLAVFGGMVYAAGRHAGFFEPSETLHATFAAVEGLRPEAPVRLAGVPVGELDPSGLRRARRGGEDARQQVRGDHHRR